MGKQLPPLSKSRCVSGWQCPKKLWLQCYQPELAGEIDEAQQALFDQGKAVGLMAHKAFPGGVLVEADHKHPEEAIARTRELMADKRVPAIFEAAFRHENVLIRVDVLERGPSSRWRLVEVKMSASVKEPHVPDMAVQQHVLAGCGVTISDACLMHLSRDYVYGGGEYDPGGLFAIESLRTKAEAFGIEELLRDLWRVLRLESAPAAEPGGQCTDPYKCEFYDTCNPERPDDWVGNLPRISAGKVEDLVSMGVTSITKIPKSFPLSQRQRLACDCVCSGKPHFGTGLKGALSALNYPLFFMDFETCNPALPPFAGMRPYDQLPFQWSVHVQASPGGPFEHHEFLGDGNSDPREGFIAGLLAVLGDKGTIVAYNATFEKTRLKDLAGWFPGYSAKISAVIPRIWDLLPVIREHVYHPKFRGSYSLKLVLPALVPELTYEGMAVADGTAAGLAYGKLGSCELPASERVSLRKAMLEYCGQDSLAMAKLLSTIR